MINILIIITSFNIIAFTVIMYLTWNSAKLIRNCRILLDFIGKHQFPDEKEQICSKCGENATIIAEFRDNCGKKLPYCNECYYKLLDNDEFPVYVSTFNMDKPLNGGLLP
jgi:hypothetical protein